MLSAFLIFLGTYAVLAIGRLPGFRVDRTGAAIIGAALMIAFNVLSFQEAYAAIDYDTIILLFGMMIVVANLRLSGFFRAVAAWAVERAHRPVLMLAAIVAVAGVFSAVFVNDTMCLVLTPLVLEATAALRRNPVPFLLAVAMGANVGSVATITGNPQNMMIGSFSRIGYGAFAAALAPVAAIGLALTVAAIVAAYWKEFRVEERVEIEKPRVRVDRPLMWKSLAVTAGMLGFFVAGWPVPKVALVAGALLLLTRRVKPQKVYHEIDWQLLVMFIGLFIVIAGVEKTTLASGFFGFAARFGLGRVGVLERGLGGAFEHREQRSGGADLQAADPAPGESAAGVAGAGDVLDAGGEPDGARLGSEPDCRGVRAPRGADRVLGILQGGRSAGAGHHCGGCALAEVSTAVRLRPPREGICWSRHGSAQLAALPVPPEEIAPLDGDFADCRAADRALHRRPDS